MAVTKTPEFQLSAEQREQFERDGFLVIRNFFSKDTAKELLDEAQDMLENFDLKDHPMTVFTTSSDKKHVGDDYFLESGDKIRYFFEKGAFTDGALNRPKSKAINKIGHYLHELNPKYRAFTLENPNVQALAKGLAVHEDPRVIQSMVICKQPQIGGVVNSHDDSTFLYSNPLSAVGFWFALEDCTPTNSCLSFVPGSHKTNVIHRRLVRSDGTGTHFETLVPDHTPPNWDAEDVNWVAAPCEAGDVVLIHGSVIHRSEANSSDKSRFIYTYHMIDASCEWDEKNWLQPNEKGFSKLFA